MWGHTCKNALSHKAVDRAIMPTTSEHINTINTFTITKWQGLWDHSNTGHHDRDLQPLVTNKSKFAYDRGRHRESVITKLRLGRCGLNHYLHKLNHHQTGLCDYCLLPKTIEHFIFICTNQANLQNDLSITYASLKLPYTLSTVLNNVLCQYKIYTAIASSDRKL